MSTKVKLTSLSVEVKERTTYDYFITIDGKKYDADDLYHTLDAVTGGDITIDEYPNGKMLLENKVVKSLGSQRNMMGATEGENFVEFRNALRAGLEESGYFGN